MPFDGTSSPGQVNTTHDASQLLHGSDSRIESLETQIADAKNKITEKEMSAKEKRSYEIALEAMTSGFNLNKDTAEIPAEKTMAAMKAYEARNMAKSRISRKEKTSRKETKSEKKTVKTKIYDNGVQKTTRSISKVSRFQETTVISRTRTSAYVRDTSSMAVKMETINEEPEEDDEAMIDAEAVEERSNASDRKNDNKVVAEDDDEPDFENMWNEAAGIV